MARSTPSKQPGKLGSLRVVRGAVAYEVALRPGALMIGRDARLGLCLNDASVSRRHAVLVTALTGVELHDLGARNGVSLNGTRIAARGRVQLAPGDRLQLGDTELTYTLPGAKVAPVNAAPSSASPAKAIAATPQAAALPQAAARPSAPLAATPNAIAPDTVPPPAPGLPVVAHGSGPGAAGGLAWWATPALWALAGAALVLAMLAAGLALLAVVLLLLRPAAGVPVSGVPVSGASVSGVPVSGVPVSGAPAPIAPVLGAPAPIAGEPGAPAPVVAPPGLAPASDAPAALTPVPLAPAAAPATPAAVDTQVASRDNVPLSATTPASAETLRVHGPATRPRQDEAPPAEPPAPEDPPAPPALHQPTPAERAALSALGQRLLGRPLEPAALEALLASAPGARVEWLLAQEALYARAWAEELWHQGLGQPGQPVAPPWVGLSAELRVGRDPLDALAQVVASPAWARRHLGGLDTARAVFERVLAAPGQPAAPSPEWHAAQRACEGEEVQLLGGRVRSARELLRLVLGHARARTALQARMAARALGRAATEPELTALAAEVERRGGWFAALVELACQVALPGAREEGS